MTNYSDVETDVYTSEEFEDESEFLEEYEWDDIPIKCNACFGTGLDRYVDADCINCEGDGYV